MTKCEAMIGELPCPYPEGQCLKEVTRPGQLPLKDNESLQTKCKKDAERTPDLTPLDFPRNSK